MYYGDYPGSAMESEKFVQFHPMLLTAYEEMAANCLNIGIALLRQGSPSEARSFFVKTLKAPEMINSRIKELSPDELELWKTNNSEPILSITPKIKVNTGAANLFLGNTKAGQILIDTAFNEDPLSPEIVLWKSLILDLEGNKKEFRALIERASAQNPDIVRSYELIKKLIKK